MCSISAKHINANPGLLLHLPLDLYSLCGKQLITFYFFFYYYFLLVFLYSQFKWSKNLDLKYEYWFCVVLFFLDSQCAIAWIRLTGPLLYTIFNLKYLNSLKKWSFHLECETRVMKLGTTLCTFIQYGLVLAFFNVQQAIFILFNFEDIIFAHFWCVINI